MTTLAIPRGERRESAAHRVWRGLFSGLRRGGAAMVRPHRAALSSLAGMPLTVAGFGCLDAAAVWWNPVVGLASAGVLLIVLELMIADEQ
jgi:hypothetical protein